MLAPTPDRVAVTGRADASSGVWVIAPPAAPEVFYAQMGALVGGKTTSPRERSAMWLRYPAGAMVAGPPRAGSTISVNGVPFEVCEDADPLMSGSRPVGYELKVVGVGLAYPSPAEIRDSGGDTIARFGIAMWSPKETSDGRGERVGEDGEAPAWAYGALVPRNTIVRVGDQDWRVTACTLDPALGRVLLNLRNTRGED